MLLIVPVVSHLPLQFTVLHSIFVGFPGAFARAPMYFLLLRMMAVMYAGEVDPGRFIRVVADGCCMKLMHSSRSAACLALSR